jgi:RNase H-like domain found in reverse transcriptase
VEAILQRKAPKTLKQLRSFLGLVNYYRDMWKQRSHLLTPLTEVTQVPCGSKTFKWTQAQDKAFHEVKKVITQNALLKFPDFNKVFDIHTDASDYQLGSVISQDGQPIAFYSRKLTKKDAT